MKEKVIYLLLILLILASCAGNRKYDDLMQRADSIMNADDDSAKVAIRKMSASVPVIAVSAYAYEKDKTAAIESGCNDFLTKPVSADLLKMTINKYLKQK